MALDYVKNKLPAQGDFYYQFGALQDMLQATQQGVNPTKCLMVNAECYISYSYIISHKVELAVALLRSLFFTFQMPEDIMKQSKYEDNCNDICAVLPNSPDRAFHETFSQTFAEELWRLCDITPTASLLETFWTLIACNYAFMNRMNGHHFLSKDPMAQVFRKALQVRQDVDTDSIWHDAFHPFSFEKIAHLFFIGSDWKEVGDIAGFAQLRLRAEKPVVAKGCSALNAIVSRLADVNLGRYSQDLEDKLSNSLQKWQALVISGGEAKDVHLACCKSLTLLLAATDVYLWMENSSANKYIDLISKSQIEKVRNLLDQNSTASLQDLF